MSVNIPGGISVNAGIDFWLGQTVTSMDMWIKEFGMILKEVKESRG